MRYLRPYPVEYFDEPIPPGAPVAVAGMGLVGFDVLTALTVGRGGTYEHMGRRKRYVPSGREPVIHLYSRSGVPYCAKSAHGVDPYGEYQPVVCTPEEFAELTHPGGSPIRRQVDFRNELLPLLFAEMQARYYTHAAFLKGGVEESSDGTRPPALGLARRRFRERRTEAGAAVRAIRSRPARSSPASAATTPRAATIRPRSTR